MATLGVVVIKHRMANPLDKTPREAAVNLLGKVWSNIRRKVTINVLPIYVVYVAAHQEPDVPHSQAPTRRTSI